MPLHCLDKHPTQPHIVATGGQESTLCIWDMRQDKFPVTLLSAHSADSKCTLNHRKLKSTISSFIVDAF